MDTYPVVIAERTRSTRSGYECRRAYRAHQRECHHICSRCGHVCSMYFQRGSKGCRIVVRPHRCDPQESE